MTTRPSIPTTDAKRSRKSLIDELVDLRAQLAATEAACRRVSQKRAKQQIPLSAANDHIQEDLWTTLEGIGDGFFFCDDQWRFVYVNRQAEALLGIRRQEVIGKSYWKVFPQILGSQLEGEYRRAAAGEVRDFENHHAPWERWFHYRCFPRKDGGMSVYFRDVSERKRVEQKLIESESLHRITLSSISDAIFITDDSGGLTYICPNAEVIFGYSYEEIKTIQNIEQLLGGRLFDSATLATSGELKNIEHVIEDKAGRNHHLLINVKQVAIKDGTVLYTCRDVSEHEKTKAQLDELNQSLIERTKQAEQRACEIQRLAMEVSSAENRERKRLAAILHDDFQQTLAYLKLKLANLHKGAGLTTNLATLNTIIDGCIQNCRHLAQELNPQLIEQKGFVGALRWICSQMKAMHGLDVSLLTTEEPDIQPIDLASILLRSIRELLFNVVKHSGEMHANLQVHRDENRVLITVADTGRGCDYDRFGQRQIEESVYGLFSIEDRITLLGGHVTVRTQPGRGFRVTLEVPYTLPVQSKMDPITVILADDHEVMRDGLAKLLQAEEDIDIVGLAANGQEAVEMAVAVKPDIVVMDVSMPVMNGIDAAAEIKQRLPQAAVIGLTMHADLEIQRAMLEAGSHACLTKSESTDRLVDTIRSLFPNRK